MIEAVRSTSIGRLSLLLPPPLALAVVRHLHLEPGERPSLDVGRRLLLPDEPLVAALEHLGSRLEANFGMRAGTSAGSLT
jgi:hypothetical protein